MAENKITTSREKYLWIAIAALALILILFLVFRWLNFWQFMLVLLVGGGIYLYMNRKKRQLDVYDIVEAIKARHFKNTGTPIDDSIIEAIESPLGSGRIFVEFKNEARTYCYFNDTILGIQIKQVSTIANDMEKSKLAEAIMKQGTTRDQIKQAATKFGLDTESLGLD